MSFSIIILTFPPLPLVARTDGSVGAYSSTCPGSTTPTTGSVITGYMIMYASYSDNACTTLLSSYVSPVGVCIAEYYGSTDGTPTGGVKYSADSNGYTYVSLFKTGTCSGTAISSNQLSISQQACTYNSADGHYSKYNVYTATIPKPPTGVAWTQTSSYQSGSCTGTPAYIQLAPTTR